MENKKIAVHCETKEQWEEVQEKAFGEGMKWSDSGVEKLEFPSGNICIEFWKSQIAMESRDTSERVGKTILSASDYLAYGLEGKPTYEVPLRVGDSVRVSSYGYENNKEFIIERIDSNLSFPYILSGGVNSTGNDLELIPTEADITVGSVWEGIGTSGWNEGETRTIEEVCGDGCYKYVYTKEVQKGVNTAFNSLLEHFKLIHRGDGEVKLRLTYTTSSNNPVSGKIKWIETDEAKPNKKEKKMKRAEKVIKEKDAVIDRECNNEGIVVAVYPETNQASYKDNANGKVLTVDIGRLYQQFVAPKPKPVKAKKKNKKTGRGKK